MATLCSVELPGEKGIYKFEISDPIVFFRPSVIPHPFLSPYLSIYLPTQIYTLKTHDNVRKKHSLLIKSSMKKKKKLNNYVNK